MCYTCFINGDHKGHKFNIRRSGQGVCDCGDPDGLKPSGYCKNHTGHGSLDESISDEVIRIFKKELIKILAALIFYSTLKPDIDIKKRIYKDVLYALCYLWKHLKKGFKENQNTLLLVLDTITDSEILKENFPKNKFEILTQKVESQLRKKEIVIKRNLTEFSNKNQKSNFLQFF
jgi:hypothetical protein